MGSRFALFWRLWARDEANSGRQIPARLCPGSLSAPQSFAELGFLRIIKGLSTGLILAKTKRLLCPKSPTLGRSDSLR